MNGSATSETRINMVRGEEKWLFIKFIDTYS
jgi:hypothetical protein